MTPAEGGAAWNGLSYGGAEELLAGLHGTTREAVRTRFRKLRLRPFPDEIRSGTGVRIAYDLPRLLALAAVFDLNRLFVPQGHAIALVQAGWPEWCRAAIAAACEAGLMAAPKSMPRAASPVLRIHADAFHEAEALQIPEQDVDFDPDVDQAAETPSIAVDMRRTVTAIVEAAGASRSGALDRSFSTLELAFGWTPPPTPHRAAVASMSTGRGFLDEGPYFERAEALLRADPADFSPDRPAARRRLQLLLAYLEDPAPIDRWKGEIGDEEGRPRLKHLISGWAVDEGLVAARPFPATFAVSGGADLAGTALEYIRRARAVRPPPTS